MSVHESGEMYLEAIYVLREKTGFVRSIDVSEYLGYSKPSVSRAMGILRSGEYITIDTDGGITLTEKGKEIALGELDPDVALFHAGTARKDGKLITSGGRVLGVVAKGETLEQARQKVYANAERIHFEGMYYRKDIGIKYQDICKE